MAPEDREECIAAIRLLYGSYRKTLTPDVGEMMYNILRRKFVPLSLLKRAVVSAAESERTCPTIATILSYCDRVVGRQAQQVKLPPPEIAADGSPYCVKCRDTGFEQLYCCGSPALPEVPTPKGFVLSECHAVRKQQAHLPHSFVTECRCRANNPMYQQAHPPKPKTFAGEPDKKW